MRINLKRIIPAVLALLILGVTLGACSQTEDAEKQQQSEVKETVGTLKKVRGKVPYPQVEDSLELRNLKKRYERLDDANKIGYVYLISFGKIFAEYQIKGKVSSLNSQFTNPKQNIDNCDGACSGYVIDQAEPDGSYGLNPDGIFFETVDGVYVEWSGQYQYSDERLELKEPVQAVLLKEAE